MKKHILSAAIFLFLLSFFPAACGAKEAVTEEITWQGIEPGMEDLTDITERKEFFDVTAESETLFEFSRHETPRRSCWQSCMLICAQGRT